MTHQPATDWRWVWGRCFVALASILPLGAGQAPLPKAASIPQPPMQGAPWIAPANRLPKSLVESTVVLYENGVADPRGCEYRDFDFASRASVSGRGFVLPERTDAPGRYAIGWDGQLYRLERVGEPADLDGDIKTLAATIVHAHSDRGWAFPPGKDGGHFGLSGLVDSTSIKLSMLLRLGRSDLAEALLAAGTNWTPKDPDKILAGPPFTEHVMSAEWLRTAHENLVAAHLRGDDALALDTVRRMKQIRDRAEDRLAAAGFARPRAISGLPDAGDDPIFPFLTQFEPLRLDHEQRALLPPRGPIPRQGGDPAARIAALIRELDQIAETQGMSNMGSAHPEDSPLVAAIVAAGPPAVEPLLAVFESDDRLTRSVTSQTRREPFASYIHPVYEVAFFALIRLLPTGEFGSERPGVLHGLERTTRRVIAMRFRRHWEQTKDIPLVEQWYQILLDDRKPRGTWASAASAIVALDSVEPSVSPRPGKGPMVGESLRLGKDPSVTQLIVRRIEDCRLSFDPDQVSDPALDSASRLAISLSSWDEAASLPWLRELTREWRMRSDVWLARTRSDPVSRDVIKYLTEFTTIRVRLGDLKALDDYAVWIGSTTPAYFGYSSFDSYLPMVEHPDHPSIARTARWLFTSPISPWVPLAISCSSGQPHVANLFASPLVVLPGFREGLLVELNNRRDFGRIKKVGPNQTEAQFTTEPLMGGFGSQGLALEEIPIGVSVSFRTCDYIAAKVSEIPGAPLCELHWPEARRDEVVKATIDFVKRYGDRFVGEASPRGHDIAATKAHLAFPSLNRPATADDVAQGRAIFALDGLGEKRILSISKFPEPARRVVGSDETEGQVWQAEEIHNGGVWERYYGFVGPHAVERVPASEIEFGERYSGWGKLNGGLDVLVVTTESHGSAYQPGGPIVLSLRIRNRLGIDRKSPTEFLRVGPDGKPSFRRGVTLELAYEPTPPLTASRFNFHSLMKKVPPRRQSQFEPGDASRSLMSLESFEAVRIDVNDWFDATRPGLYQLILKFTAESGLGEGMTPAGDFRVGDDE